MDSLGDRFWQIMDASVSEDCDAQLDDLGAAYVINGGCSDDGFIDFRSWLIAQGKSVCDAALTEPESLAGHIKEAFAAFEEFAYVPIEVFEAKHDEVWPKSSTFPSELTGKRWQEDELDRLLAKLTAKVAELEEM